MRKFVPKDLTIVHEEVWDIIVETLSNYRVDVIQIPSDTPEIIENYVISLP